MSTIQFAGDAIHPVRSNTSVPNGVFATRNRSRSRSRISTGSGGRDAEHLDEKGDGTNASLTVDDVKRKQTFSTAITAWLAYQSIGVIYGDIGTSPLYVYSSTFSSNPSYDDLVGALSLIIWSLTLIVSVKYVAVVLYADDEGEGGTFALYSLLSRYANLTKREPKEQSMVNMQRYRTNDLKLTSRVVRNGLERSTVAKALLKLIGVLGVSMVMADGVLTPAQSVLGAIQGINVVAPSISIGTITGVSCAILILLFLAQPLGTGKLAGGFAPVVIIWLLFNAVFGIYNLALQDHSVLKAFSPYFAGAYLVRNGTEGWKSLGGILLCFTGVEALFADLGAFSRPAIQISWLFFAFPCLLLAYIGQAAFISVHPSAYSNPFFNSVPPGMFWPSLIVAILAAIVASQAMITASFQLLSQIMKLSYFPQLKVVHTSSIHYGQIYIPFANWLLMVGTVIVTAVYNNTTSLGNAYGVCVIFVCFITINMLALVALVIWRRNPVLVLFSYLVFGSLDGAYLSSVLLKVPQGAWLTLAIAFVLCAIFTLWRYGKECQWAAEALDRFPSSQLVDSSGGPDHLNLTKAFGGAELTTIRGYGIFFDKQGDMTPTVFLHFLTKFGAMPEVAVFFHLRPLPMPTVPPENRYRVSRTSIPRVYRLVVRHGYTDAIITSQLSMLVYEQVRDFVIREHATARPGRSPTMGTAPAIADDAKQAVAAEKVHDPSTSTTLAHLTRAYERQVLYVVGKEQLRVGPHSSMVRKVLLQAYLWLREHTRPKMSALKIPFDQLVEVGFVKEV